MSLQNVLKILLENSADEASTAPTQEQVQFLVDFFLKGTKGKWGDLRNPRNARNKCEPVAKEFTKLLHLSGFKAKLLKMAFPYLGEGGTIAFEHFATGVELETGREVVVDFTISQFLGEEVDLPVFFADGWEEWAAAIDDPLDGRYDLPIVSNIEEIK